MSDRVFVEVKKKGAAKSSKGKEPEGQTLQQSLVDLNLGITEEDLAQDEAGRAALYGVYLDDRDYDYTKHLRSVGSGGGVILEAPGRKEKPMGIQILDKDVEGDGLLPAEVLPSSHRMDIKSEAFPTGPQPFMDRNLREVLEALDQEEEVDELDDDFLDKLNSDQPPSDAEEEEYDDMGEFEDDEDFDPDDVFAQVRRMKERQLQQQQGSDEDMSGSEADGPRGWGGARTTSTGFSMSSSAMYRNDKLTLLDEHFDKIEAMYEREETDSEDERYDSDGHHIVEYDEEGNVKPISTRPDFESVMDEFLSEYELTGRRMQVVVEGGDGAGKLDTVRNAFLKQTKSKEENRKELLEVGNRIIDEDNRRTEKDEEEYFDQLFKEKQRTPWDCQTILTTYSTLENHPSTIYEERTPRIRVSRKTGLPLVENVAAEAASNDAQGDLDETEEDEERSRENLGKPRSKAETSEEKRARKKQLQEAKRERRDQKKENRGAFAEKHDRKMQSRKDRAQYVVRLD
ncbi:Protein ltv1 [Coemansia sp. RSA 2607]|nr:Protein ltv1 [Coemansia sp. RSA 2607]